MDNKDENKIKFMIENCEVIPELNVLSAANETICTRFQQTAARFLSAEKPHTQAEQPHSEAEKPNGQAQMPCHLAQMPYPVAAGTHLNASAQANLALSPFGVSEFDLVRELFDYLPRHMSQLLQMIRQIDLQTPPEEGVGTPSLLTVRGGLSALQPKDHPSYLGRGLSTLISGSNIMFGLSFAVRQQLLSARISPMHLLCELNNGCPSNILGQMQKHLQRMSVDNQLFVPSASIRELKRQFAQILSHYSVQDNFISDHLNLNVKYLKLLKSEQARLPTPPACESGILPSDSLLFRREPSLILLNTIAINFYGIMLSCLYEIGTLRNFTALISLYPVNHYLAVAAYDCMRALLELRCFDPWRLDEPLNIPSYKLFFRSLQMVHNRQVNLRGCARHILNSHGKILQCTAFYLPAFTRADKTHEDWHAVSTPCPICTLRPYLKNLERRMQLRHQSRSNENYPEPR